MERELTLAPLVAAAATVSDGVVFAHPRLKRVVAACVEEHKFSFLAPSNALIT